MEVPNKEGKISWVLGLVIECPLQDPVKNCPAKELRQLPVHECAAMISKMEEVQLDKILAFHRHCIRNREHQLTNPEA